MKDKKKWLAGHLLIFAWILSACGQPLQLSLGSHAVTTEEYESYLEKNQYFISQYFMETYGFGEGSSDTFWITEQGGEIPYKKLADDSISQLKHSYAAYELAEELGYLDSSSFEKLKERCANENQSRKTKMSNGQTVYGLKEYSLDLYRDYELDMLKTKYMEDLSNQGMTVSDQDARTYYEANRDPMFAMQDDITLSYVRIPYASDSPSAVTEKQDAMSALHAQLLDGMTLENVVRQSPLLESGFARRTILSGEYGAQSRDIQDILELSNNLKAGEITPVLDQNNCLYLIQCTERISHDYTPYEEAKPFIENQLREQQYNTLLSERAESLPFKGDMEPVYEYTKEYLS